jgi:hypothetical protein
LSSSAGGTGRGGAGGCPARTSVFCPAMTCTGFRIRPPGPG